MRIIVALVMTLLVACIIIVLFKLSTTFGHEAVSFSSLVSNDEKHEHNHNEIGDRPRILIIFTNAKSNTNLQSKLQLTLRSMFEHASSSFDLYIAADPESRRIVEHGVINAIHKDFADKVKLHFLDMESVGRQVKDTLGPSLLNYFRHDANSYYGDYLFFVSMVAHNIFPDWDKLIQIDSDLKFEADIFELWDKFNEFEPSQIMGIARENQPVYRHIWNSYRREHKGTKLGDPPPHGITGFNSGVLLLNLQRIRESQLYSELLTLPSIERLVAEYKFKGHLGDQDFYTLLSTEYLKELFYVLPCEWNRQLCTWWKSHGYLDVFEQYYNCKAATKIFHGNCNTPIPQSPKTQ